VNTERWLCVSVFDLLSQKQLMKQAPVIRLL
jgi:hypothetical protein